MKQNVTKAKKDFPDLLSLKLDYMFKRVFGDERNADIMALFLSAVLKMPIEEFDRIQFLDPSLKKDREGDKISFLDLNLRIKNGTEIIIEIQVIDRLDFANRAAYYACKKLTGQISEGESYLKLKPVIGINIVDFDLFDCEEHHSSYLFKERDRNDILGNLIRIDFLELKKAKRKYAQNGGIIIDKEFAWLALINAQTKEEAQMLAQKEPALKRAVAEVIRLSGDEAARAAYEARQKALRDWNTSQEISKAMGIEEGIAIGEERARVNIARNLLAIGLPLEQIALSSGLSLKEIEKLKYDAI
jgi:predicted transposase/invertase (TIGR01784 family)